ncbi:MAG: PKD domain-containing protein, partial [Nanoarchaeota archaeon]|nr:PKD domain-containing protein [Nanoarchaeota archaeon]
MEKRKGIKYFFALILAVFIFSFVAATYDFSDYSIQDLYSKGSSISGTIEISFEDEPINSLFTDSLGNSVELRELLFASQNYPYTCSYANCESRFVQGGIGSTFTFSLPKGQSTFYGLIFNQNLVKINSARFDLQSDATESPTNQISVDFFNDEIVDVKNTNPGNTLGEENFGCFNSSQSQTEVTLTTTPYCQEILLNETPGVYIGAWVKEVTAGTKNVTMTLYTKEGNIINGCQMSKNDLTSYGSRAFCSVDVSVPEEGKYFVCISSGASGSGDYKVRGFSQANNCGFQGIPPKTPVYSYEIGARQKYFGNVGTINILNTLKNGNNLSQMIENYIVSEYGTKDCSANPCYVPIKITSAKDQSVTIKNLNVNYDFIGGSGVTMTTFYKFDEDPSEVTSSMGNLNLGQFFKLPNEEANLTYKLNYKGDELFEEEISVKDFGISIYPLRAAANFPTDFVAHVPSTLNPTLYTWEFGDGQSKITNTPNVRTTYNEEGSFTLTLTVKTNVGDIPTGFDIIVGSPKEVLSYEIQKRKSNLDLVENLFSSLSTFEQDEVKKILDIPSLRASLEIIEEEEALATTEEEYAHIISELLNLSSPLSLGKYVVRQSFYIPSSESIDLNALSLVTGRTYNYSQSTYDYVQFWNVDKLDSDITESQVVVFWDEKPESTIRFFELTVSQSESISEDYYFIIKNLGGLSFRSLENVQSVEGNKYIKLSSSTERIEFSTTQAGEITGFMFISPSVIDIQDVGEISEPRSNFWILILGLIAVLLIGLFIYLILHRWYRVKYESYLFPDKNHLYNAIFYITNSVKNGMENSEIRESLLKSGWTGEQVNYLMKKHAGKN